MIKKLCKLACVFSSIAVFVLIALPLTVLAESNDFHEIAIIYTGDTNGHIEPCG